MQYNPYAQPNAPSLVAQPKGDAHTMPQLGATSRKQQTIQKLQKEVGKSEDVLVEATTIFPFTLFPDTVRIDRAQITITTRDFFRVAETLSIRIEDVLNVTANVGPFLGSITISSGFFDANKPYHVNYLWRSDALRIKRIMQGYLIAKKKKVDCSALSTKELADLLDNLGQGEPTD